MPESQSSEPRDAEEVRAEPYDKAGDQAAGAKIRDAGPTTPPAAGSSSNAWAMVCHLCGLADFFNLFFGLGILIPLGIWLARRDSDPFVERHGREAINFQLNVLFWSLVFGVLSCCLIGIPFLIALPVAETVLVILAAIEAAGGRPFRYPLTLRLL